MYYKQDWLKVKERLTALLHNEIVDRCCISVSAPKVGKGDPTVFAVGPVNRDDPKDILEYWTNPARILSRNIARFENTVFGGEALPQIWLNFGTSGHALYFGAKYALSPETLWCFPIIEDWEEDTLQYDENNPFLLQQLQIALEIAEAAKGRFFVSMPDTCGSLDALGHLRGTENVLIDMMTEPETVSTAIKSLNDGWKKANDRFFDIIKTCDDNGSTHGWMNLWANGKLAQMQCDMSVMFSPSMYEQFVVPELQEQINALDYAIYHFDGQEQIQHLDHLLALDGLNMIQWTHVAGQPPASHFIPTLKRIQQAGKGLILYITPDEVPVLMEELSSKGLYLNTTAEDEAHCAQLVDYVSKHTHE